MRKLIVTCQCGQRMQVPRSAVGKTGMCPTCGQTVTITNDNAVSTPPPGQSGSRPLHAKQVWWQGRGAPPEEAKRRFGEAVDLYYNGRYAEAMAVFDALAKQFPGNSDIENGRTQCMTALRRPKMQLEDRTGGMSSMMSSALHEGRLDRETVRLVILEKMLHGATETIQLQAAELAARLLGMFPDGPLPEEETKPEGESHEAAPAETEVQGEAPAGTEGEASAEAPTDGTAEAMDEVRVRRMRGAVPNESDLEKDRRRAVPL